MKSTTRIRALGALGALATLAACSTIPEGPSMLVLPGTGRTFQQFQADDAMCRQYALRQSGGSPQQAADASGVRSAALATAVGAIAGAAIDGSRGAAVGAGSGLVLGTMSGTGSGQASASAMQRRYDHAYVQCMYAQGHRVPVSGQVGGQSYRSSSSQYYQSAPVPPPPAGIPPPPPPGIYRR